MKQKFLTLPLLILYAGLLLSCAQEKSAAKNSESGLSGEGQKVVDYLLEDWNSQFRSTSIALAMNNLGMQPDDDLRLEVGEHFRNNSDLANNLKWWGANNYLLNNDEKRLAKYLINTYDANKTLLTPEEASKAIGLPKNDLQARLAFMAEAGFLQKSSEAKLGYALAEGHNTWGGPLRYNFHTVAAAGEKPFDVWWAIDFLLLVNSYGDKEVKIEDSCAHCYKKISVTIRGGEIAAMTPETVWAQQGGGWAVDNLFWSEEHLNEWLDANPNYKELSHASIRDFLLKIKAKKK